MLKSLEVKMLLNIFDLVTRFEIDRPGVEVKMIPCSGQLLDPSTCRSFQFLLTLRVFATNKRPSKVHSHTRDSECTRGEEGAKN